MRRMASSFLCALLVILVSGATTWAGGGPENLILVVNAESPSSLLIANHYISLRGIPERNVIYLDGIPERELMDVMVFKRTILQPLLEEIEKRKLAPQIDYIVYSADFPTIITLQHHQNLLIAEAKKQGETLTKESKRVYNPHGSINAITYFAFSVIKDQPSYMLLNSNFYYRDTTKNLLTHPFVGDTQKEFEAALELAEKDLPQAIAAMESLQAKHPRQLAILYQLAKLCARNGDPENAATWLKQAIANGWMYRSHTQNDRDLKAALDSTVFRNVVNQIPDEKFEIAPTLGFRHRTFWSPNGSINGTPTEGRPYFLSTVLAVTRNHGCTERQALNALKANAVVDGTHPQGTFYFADTKDVRNRTRQPNYRQAVETLKRLGMKARIIQDIIPIKQDRVMGLTNGTAKFDWKTGGSKLLPGAICDNLTSHGGMLCKASQTKCTEFIAAGAAGASGTVIEPYAIQAKFPHPMIHAHYARGASLAEAFYQSVHGPFQLLIVGDALCQPFATIPTFKYEGLKPEQVVSGAVEINLDFADSPVRCKAIELYIDGLRVNRRPVSDRLRFDSAKITDGYHELRVVVVADNPLETRGRTVFPIFVRNHGHRVNLKTSQASYKSKEEIEFEVRSNYGGRIELKHNARVLGESKGKEASFSVPAATLGRGPVRLTAISYDANDVPVCSVPLQLRITGEISNQKRSTEGKPK